MKNQLYNIAVVINDKYVTMLIIMLKSLFIKNPNGQFFVYILYSSFSIESLSKLREFFTSENKEYNLIQIDKSVFDSAPILDQDMSKEAYFKLLLPILLPPQVKRVLYLDADIIINNSINSLYTLDLQGKCFAAVADLNMDRDEEYKGRLMPLTFTYFNSGVMLFDLETFRKIYNFDVALNYIQLNGSKFRFHDQEVFNALFYDKVFIMEERFNFVTLYRDRWDPLLYRFRDNLKEIVVIHYAAGNNKPWKPFYYGKFLNNYWLIAKMIGFHEEYARYCIERRKFFCKILKEKFCIIFPNIKSNTIKSILWPYYWMKYFMPPIFKKYSKQDFLLPEEVNQFIAKSILEQKPFMACRLGANESFTLRTYEFNHKKNEEKALEQLCTCAGFFPNKKKYAYKFLKIMKSSFSSMDMCGILKCPFDDYFLNKYAKKECKTMMLYNIDPIVYNNPWTMALEGKKVLVIHPFAESIQKQYLKKEKIFPNKKILPEFDLITLPAVQTSAGQVDERFRTWFDALDYMSEEIMKLDFDVALLGCGAYGLPLAAKIKKMGKQAIHIGGGLQILFGIKGKRWDDNPNINCYYNEAWVYPSSDEKPQNANLVEGACYWG